MLLIASLLLLVFGLAEARLLDRLLIGPAPLWLGVMVPLGVAIGIRRRPRHEAVPWVLVACGWLVAISARLAGWEMVSVAAWASFGTVTLGYAMSNESQPGPERRLNGWQVALICGCLLGLTMLILLWP